MLSMFAAQSLLRPSSGVRKTSDGMSRTVVVIGAIGDLLSLRSAFAVSAVAPLLGLPLILLLPGKSSRPKETS